MCTHSPIWVKIFKAALISSACCIVIYGLYNRFNHERKYHKDNVEIERAILHMEFANTLDPDFYHHPNHLGIYSSFTVAKITNFITSKITFEQALQNSPKEVWNTVITFNIFISALEILFIVLIGWNIHPYVGLFAGFLVSKLEIAIYYANTMRPDSFFSTTIGLSLWCMILLHQKFTYKRLIICVISIGMATAVKYPGILLLLPLAVVLFENLPKKTALKLSGFSFIGVFSTLLIIAPYLFYRSYSVVQSIRFGMRKTLGPPGSQSELEALGFIGNLQFYFEQLLKHTDGILIVLSVVGLLFTLRKSIAIAAI